MYYNVQYTTSINMPVFNFHIVLYFTVQCTGRISTHIPISIFVHTDLENF